MINVYIKFLTTKTELDYTQVQRAAIKILFWVAAVKRRWDAYCIVLHCSICSLYLPTSYLYYRIVRTIYLKIRFVMQLLGGVQGRPRWW